MIARVYGREDDGTPKLLGLVEVPDGTTTITVGEAFLGNLAVPPDVATALGVGLGVELRIRAAEQVGHLFGKGNFAAEGEAFEPA